DQGVVGVKQAQFRPKAVQRDEQDGCGEELRADDDAQQDATSPEVQIRERIRRQCAEDHTEGRRGRGQEEAVEKVALEVRGLERLSVVLERKGIGDDLRRNAEDAVARLER